jgi:ATP-dependent NAD(P)H-hydrate dehydratase
MTQSAHSPQVSALLDEFRKDIMPPLANSAHKGQAGKLLVIGGSFEYTGAPYTAAFSAMRAGMDLAHVLCTPEAATAIKSYSPELIVHPSLSDWEAQPAIINLLTRVHGVLIGPGLGRADKVIKHTRQIFGEIQKLGLPLILDGDAIYLLTQHPEVIQDFSKVIITPNHNEFIQLCKMKSLPENAAPDEVSRLFRGATIVQKGSTDRIAKHGEKTVEVAESGSLRRCGGQGDVLAGVTAAFAIWCFSKNRSPVCGATAAAVLTRMSGKVAFEKYKRSMLSGDMIEALPECLEELFPLGASPA